MALTRDIGRTHHVAIVVRPENHDACVRRLSEALGATFYPTVDREDLHLKFTASWEACLEVVSPVGAASPHWAKLDRIGEGYTTIVFGVENLDEARRRAEAAGEKVLPNINGLRGNEPYFDVFETFREAKLEPIFGATICLGEITPKT